MEVGSLLSVCAESEVVEATFYGTRAILKRRPIKAYRHPTLDKKIREQRTLREARALAKARKCGVPAPIVFSVDKLACTIAMERIMGATARDVIANNSPASAVTCAVLVKIGELVARMHAVDLIHGDLTTSNFMLRVADDVQSLTVIDFGLVKQSADAEERAVDLYVLERAISSTHPLVLDPMEHVWKGYCTGGLPQNKLDLTHRRLEMVRARGRKRSMIG
jgi:TP53 regulating kinase-like protein